MTENLPTNWKDQMANEAKVLARSFRPSTTQISTKSGIMTYMGQAVPNNELNVIILATINENNFFEGKFDPRNPRNPICFAFGKPQPDGSKPSMVPPAELVEPNRQASNCDVCDWSKWNSDSESVSGKGKRCKELYKLGLIPVSGDGNEMAILRVPVTSRKNYEVYINTLAAAAARPPWGVVTKVKVKPHVKNQFEVVFSLVEPLPEEALGNVWKKIDGAYETLMQPYDPNQDPLETKAPVSDKRKKY